MPKKEKILQEFKAWLPGELNYSREKAPYGKKIQRAELPITDNQSIYGFMGQEWTHANLLREQGALYAEGHRKTAQLQYAKFAAGLLDKVGVIDWITAGKPCDQESLTTITNNVVDEYMPKLWLPTSENSLDSPLTHTLSFEETIFATEILPKIQRSIVEHNEGSLSEKGVIQIRADIFDATTEAAYAYMSFAWHSLQSNQLSLSPSVLEQ